MLTTIAQGSRIRLAASLVALVVLFAGCEVAVDVAIDVESRGAGTVTVKVTLDDEAALEVPDLAEQLRTSDLARAGWTISGPETDEDEGDVTVRASKRFQSATQLQSVLEEITGPDGMFRDFDLDVQTTFAERRYDLSGTLDLTEGEDLFGDDDLLGLLNGNVFGRPVDEMLAGGDTLSDAIPVRVFVNLPGEGEGTSPSEASWAPRFDDESTTNVSLSTLEEQFVARLLRWIGIAAGALFGLSVVLGLAGWYLERQAKSRRPKVRTPAPMANRVPGAPGLAASEQPMANSIPAPLSPSETRQMRLVVLDPIGVLYQVGDRVTDLLVSFVANEGSTLTSDEVIEAHTDLTLGRISTADFWERCEVSGDADDIDARYLSTIVPRPGSAEFLREMRRREMPVACLTNDASGWSEALRNRDNLSMIYPWIVSADAGARKPDPAIYEAMRRETGMPYEGWLLIDSSIDNLDTAKTLGMSTAYFANQRPSPHDRPSHPVVTSFSDFFRRRN